MPQDQRNAPCKPDRTHRWTVMASVKGWINCYWCGVSKRKKGEGA
jgi:hypothetical protein